MIAEFRFRKPWVGDAFSGLLIVGESHYPAEADIDDEVLTIHVISEIINGRRHRFHTKLARAISGRDIPAASFWPTVAFANFCPGLAPAPRVPPTKEMWAAGHEQFPMLLDLVKPSHVLVLGASKGRTFDNLPPYTRPERPIVSGGISREVGSYRLALDRWALATSINHPSSDFSPSSWHGFITEFLQRGVIE